MVFRGSVFLECWVYIKVMQSLWEVGHSIIARCNITLRRRRSHQYLQFPFLFLLQIEFVLLPYLSRLISSCSTQLGLESLELLPFFTVSPFGRSVYSFQILLLNIAHALALELYGIGHDTSGLYSLRVMWGAAATCFPCFKLGHKSATGMSRDIGRRQASGRSLTTNSTRSSLSPHTTRTERNNTSLRQNHRP